MLRVGLTGGIGSGKSEVARLLAGHGAVVIDADVAAREVVAPGTPGLAEVTAAFGANVLSPDGSLDRPRLGEIVFADAEAREKLNRIVHPRVRRRMADLEHAAGDASIVVHVIPLLAENRDPAEFDAVVVVDAPEEAQLARLTRGREMTRAQALARIRAQASRDQRRAIASFVVDNSGSRTGLTRAVDELWDFLRRAADAGVK